MPDSLSFHVRDCTHLLILPRYAVSWAAIDIRSVMIRVSYSIYFMRMVLSSLLFIVELCNNSSRRIRSFRCLSSFGSPFHFLHAIPLASCLNSCLFRDCGLAFFSPLLFFFAIRYYSALRGFLLCVFFFVRTGGVRTWLDLCALPPLSRIINIAIFPGWPMLMYFSHSALDVSGCFCLL